jgi:DNA-binding response OmpR family regulator
MRGEAQNSDPFKNHKEVTLLQNPAHGRASILLVDDEHDITDNLAPLLERAGFDVSVAADGKAALDQVATCSPDLIVLDVLMPKLNGREVLRHLRRTGDWTPVILLTRVGNATERAMALEEGADDYLNKPFDPYELIARIRAVLRRRAGAPAQRPLAMATRLRARDIVLDRSARRVDRDGQPLDLTARAVALLEYLMLHAQEVLTRERLLDAVWGWDYPVATRAVDARIAELRRALNDDPDAPRFIETVVGQGYRFVAPVEAPQTGEGL